MTQFPAGSPMTRGFAAGVPIAFANRSREREMFAKLAGGSQIVDASGVVLAEADADADAVLVADVPLRD